jgi:hypothetical protein
VHAIFKISCWNRQPSFIVIIGIPPEINNVPWCDVLMEDETLNGVSSNYDESSLGNSVAREFPLLKMP